MRKWAEMNWQDLAAMKDDDTKLADIHLTLHIARCLYPPDEGWEIRVLPDNTWNETWSFVYDPADTPEHFINCHVNLFYICAADSLRTDPPHRQVRYWLWETTEALRLPGISQVNITIGEKGGDPYYEAALFGGHNAYIGSGHILARAICLAWLKRFDAQGLIEEVEHVQPV